MKLKTFLFVSIIIVISSTCKKNEEIQPPPSKFVTITSINPVSAHPDSIVTISGSFPTTNAGDYTVKFNGVTALVVSVSSQSMIVEVPMEAGSGTITITTSQGTVNGPTFTYEPDIILGGYVINGAHSQAKYWINDVGFVAEPELWDQQVWGMAVSGKDVYLNGVAWDNAGNGHARLWKNGKIVPLTDDIHNSGAQEMRIVENDVYVVGSEYNGSHTIAKYWKNGVPFVLSDTTKDAYASSIIIVNNDMYVGGSVSKPNGVEVGTYWKNGVPVSLAGNYFNSEFTSIAVAGNNVYTAGWADSAGTATIYKYWINGEPVSQPSGITSLSRIKNFGNDFYIVGGETGGAHQMATYWKNGLSTHLTDGAFLGRAHDMTFFGSDVYVAGVEYDIPAGGNIFHSSAKYWKNGVAVKVTNEPEQGFLSGIVVR
jgi:hypothetical protein